MRANVRANLNGNTTNQYSMGKNLISCRPGSYGVYTLYAYEHLQEIGINHLEIPNPGPSGLDMIKDILSDFPGLKVTSIQAEIPIGKKDPGELMRTTVFDIAKTLGASHIFVSLKPGKVKERDWVPRLQGVGDVAKEYGMLIILETHPPLFPNGDVGITTMQRVNHPSIRINYDTANMYFYNENIDAIADLKKVLRYVEGVHLKESNKKFKTWYFPGLGEGEGCIDFKAVFELLNTRQDPGPMYGPFTLEIEGIKGEQPLNLEGVKARVAKSVAYLRNLGVVD